MAIRETGANVATVGRRIAAVRRAGGSGATLSPTAKVADTQDGAIDITRRAAHAKRQLNGIISLLAADRPTTGEQPNIPRCWFDYTKPTLVAHIRNRCCCCCRLFITIGVRT